MNEEQYKQHCKTKRVDLNRAKNVIENLNELSGWEILFLERFKPGVVRYHARRQLKHGCEFELGYAKDEVFKSVQLPL